MAVIVLGSAKKKASRTPSFNLQHPGGVVEGPPIEAASPEAQAGQFLQGMPPAVGQMQIGESGTMPPGGTSGRMGGGKTGEWEELKARGLVEKLTGTDVLDVISHVPGSALVGMNNIRKKIYEDAKHKLRTGDYGSTTQRTMTPMGGYTTTRSPQTRENLEEAVKEFEEREVRGESLLAGMLSGIADLPGYMGEMQAGGIGKVKSIPGAASFAAKMLPIQFGRLEDSLTDQVERGETGYAAALKALGDVYIENISETAGAGLPVVMSKMPFGSKVMKGLQGFAARKGLSASEFWKTAGTKVGYNGLVGEWFEEDAGTYLRGMLNVNDFGAGKDSTPSERWIAGMKQDYEVQNALTRLGVLSVPGAVQTVGSRIYQGPAPGPADLTPEEKAFDTRLRRELGGITGRTSGPTIPIETPAEADLDLPERQVPEAKEQDFDETPLLSVKMTRIEELVEQERVETNPKRRIAILDEIQTLDAEADQLRSLKGKSMTKIHRMARKMRFKLDKGTKRGKAIRMLAGLEDQSGIEKTEGGYRVGDNEYDNFAEAMDFALHGAGPAAPGARPVRPPTPSPIQEQDFAAAAEQAATTGQADADIAAIQQANQISPDMSLEQIQQTLTVLEGLAKKKEGPERQMIVEQIARIREFLDVAPDLTQEALDVIKTAQDRRTPQTRQTIGNLQAALKSQREGREVEGGVNEAIQGHIDTLKGMIERQAAEKPAEAAEKAPETPAAAQTKPKAPKAAEALAQPTPAGEKVKATQKATQKATPAKAGEPVAEGKAIPVRADHIQVGDKIFTTDYGYITVEEVNPVDPKYPGSLIVETSRGRRDYGPPDKVIHVERQPKGQPKRQPTEPPATAEGKVETVRYTLKDGTGLLNNQAYDLDKLNDDDAQELEELLNYGLQQPIEVSTDNVFAFTKEGEQKNARLLELLTKAARGEVVRTEQSVSADDITWRTNDGQVAIKPTPPATAEGKEKAPAKKPTAASTKQEKEAPSEQAEETITEPTPSPEVQQRAADVAELKPTGTLDPTKKEDALKIIELSKQDLQEQIERNRVRSKADEITPIAFGPLYQELIDEHGKRTEELAYTSEQVDQAYRTVQVSVDSPLRDTTLWAMPGKEKAMQALGEKMAKQKKLATKKKGVSIPRAHKLPPVAKETEQVIKLLASTTPKESKMYAISGLYVDKGKLVATDGKRMLVVKGKWGPTGLYLDRASLEKGVLGKVDKSGAKFPKYEDIIPDYPSSDAVVIDDLDAMYRRLSQAAVMTSEESKYLVAVRNTDNSIGFAVQSPEVGHAEINVQPGGQILGGLNPRFLMDALALHARRGDKRIKFYFPEPTRPILTVSDDGKTQTITMPVNAGDASEGLRDALETEAERTARFAREAEVKKLKAKTGETYINEQQFQNILKLSADSEGLLRPIDVMRVMQEAKSQDVLEPFYRRLLKGNLKTRTFEKAQKIFSELSETKAEKPKTQAEKDADLMREAEEQVTREEQEEAAQKAREVLKANDIEAEVKKVDKIDIPEGKQERRGKAVGAAITNGERQLLLLALGADAETGYHEGYHLIRPRLTAADRAILKEHYADEEAEARAFAGYIFNREQAPTTAIGRIFRYLKRILRKIRRGLAGQGMRTPQDIFGQIRTGKVRKTTTADGSRATAYEIRTPSDVFFSKLERAVEEKMPNKMAPVALRNWMAKQGIKADEIKWAGVGELIAQGKAVTKQQVLDTIRANDVRVEDVVKGKQGKTTDLRNLHEVESEMQPLLRQQVRMEDKLLPKIKKVADKMDFADKNEAQIEYAQEALARHAISGQLEDDTRIIFEHPITKTDLKKLIPDFDWFKVDAVREKVLELTDERETIRYRESAGETRFGQYTLGEGTPDNYREVLLTMPGRETASRKQAMQDLGLWDPKGNVSLQYDDLSASNKALVDARLAEIELVNQGKHPDYTSSHFAEKNILAHLRLSDRTTPDGKKVLFIEEVQSDWHQTGRERGYKGKPLDTTGWVARDKQGTRASWYVYDADSKFIGNSPKIFNNKAVSAEEAIDIVAKAEVRLNAVPDAPFKKTWHELAFKRALRFAAEEGYDTVAWTTGEQQADRYPGEMRKVVDNVTWATTVQNNRRAVTLHRHGDIIGRLYVDAESGEVETTENMPSDFIGKPLSDVIGAKMADQILQEKTGKIGGEDFVVGNKGMWLFYDQILPSFAKKYMKKWGVRVGETNIGPVTDVRVRHAETGEWIIENKVRGVWNTKESHKTENAAKKRQSIYEQDIITVHSVPVTQAMTEAVLAGQVKFETSQERAAREAEHRTRVQARFAELKAAAEGKAKKATIKPTKAAGATTIIPDLAAEVHSIITKTYQNPIKMAKATHGLVKRNVRRNTNYMRTLGPAGKKLADDVDQITYRVTRNVNNDLQDLREVYKGLSKPSREKVAKIVNGVIDSSDTPKKLRKRAVMMRGLLDNAMDEASALEMKRTVKGEKIPIGGSGKAYPQAVNEKGAQFLEEAATEGISSPTVFAWAQEQVQADKFVDIDAAISALQRFREQRMRGFNTYLESERVELPEEYIEWDGLHVLPMLLEKNWMTVEGVRQWGNSFGLANSRIETIKESYGMDNAYRVKLFIETAFGIRSVASREAQEISRKIRGFQFIAKVGLSPPTILRNMFDRIPKGFTVSGLSTIKVSAKYPPFINQFIKSAQKHEDWMIRSGAVFGHGSLSEGYEAGSVITELAAAPFSTSERGNQVFIAMVQYDKFLRDLAELKGKEKIQRRILDKVDYIFGHGTAQIKHRIKDAAGEEVLRKAMAGEELNQEEIEFMLHKAVRDRAFPMVLSTKPIWYDNHPFMKVAAQFKTWPLSQTNLIWRDVIKYTAKTRDFTRLARFLLATLLAGELYNIIRDFLFDKEESVLSEFRKDPEERRLAWAILNDLFDGGMVGVFADLTYGVYDWATGVSARTAKNVWKTGIHIAKQPRLTLQALDMLAEQEITPYRQIKRQVEKADRKWFNKGNITQAHYKWRAESWNFRDDKENPTVAGKAKALAERALTGLPEYSVGDKTLALDLAHRQVIAGDVKDAAKYLALILKDKEGADRKKAITSIKASRTKRAPLGPVAEKDMVAFFSGYSSKSRQEAKEVQRKYMQTYQRALRMAVVKAQ